MLKNSGPAAGHLGLACWVLISADDILEHFFSFLPENIGFHIVHK